MLTTGVLKLYMRHDCTSFSQQVVAGSRFHSLVLTKDKLSVSISWHRAAHALNTLKEADSVIKPSGVEV